MPDTSSRKAATSPFLSTVSKEDSSASAFTSYIHFSSAKCVSLHPRHAPAPAAASERSPARFPEARRRKGSGRTAAGRPSGRDSPPPEIGRASGRERRGHYGKK